LFWYCTLTADNEGFRLLAPAFPDAVKGKGVLLSEIEAPVFLLRYFQNADRFLNRSWKTGNDAFP
jgi:hypothetical protein